MLTGKQIVGVYTWMILLLSVSAFVMDKDIPAGVVTCYGMALGGYVTNRTVGDYAEKKSRSGKEDI